jgi:hypothetical protein
MTDFRALCEELIRVNDDTEAGDWCRAWDDVTDRARAALAEQPVGPTPIPVAERLPGPEDCIQRGDDHWCWGQERSSITGRAAARWRLMRVSSLEDEAVGWLPANALPVPSND